MENITVFYCVSSGKQKALPIFMFKSERRRPKVRALIYRSPIRKLGTMKLQFDSITQEPQIKGISLLECSQSHEFSWR